MARDDETTDRPFGERLFDPPPSPNDTLWMGMPEFEHEDLRPWATYRIHFRSPDAVIEFLDLIGEDRWSGKAFWFPPEPAPNTAALEYRRES